jgi:hypothetical protein
LENRFFYEEKQMMTQEIPRYRFNMERLRSLSWVGAPSSNANIWKAIDWKSVEAKVKRLQMRIAKATQEKRYGKVKALQWLLTHSYQAKLVAVKRVTSNKGAKTPGVDGVIWNHHFGGYTSRRRMVSDVHSVFLRCETERCNRYICYRSNPWLR